VKIPNSILIIFFSLLGCTNNEKVKTVNLIEFIGKPLVPKNIKWNTLSKQNNEHENLYSHYLTFYFLNDSILYAFDGINCRNSNCIDTSFFDKKNNIYNDSTICNHEDSILFAVENVEVFKGRYQINELSIICKFAKVIRNINENETLLEKPFLDTFKIIRKPNESFLFFKGDEYLKTANFKILSYRRLNELIEISK